MNSELRITNVDKTLKFLPYFLITAAIILRLLPHPPNFAPITAIALFSATILPRRWGIIIPLLAMIISDAYLGYYQWPIMAAVYLSFAASGLIGWWVRRNYSINAIWGGALFASIIFFLITNAAVWAFSGMYEPTLTGLFRSYYLALPFFRNTLLGDLFYVTVMFGSFEIVRKYYVVLRQAQDTSKAYRAESK